MAALKIYEKGGKYYFRCSVCSREFGSEGGFNLHGPCGPKYKKKPKVEGVVKGCANCDGKVRLLSGSVAAEKRAIDAGYVMVCGGCGVLV